MLFQIGLVALLTFANCSRVFAAAADQPPAKFTDPLELAFRLVRETVERNEVPGAIALVARGGKILRHEAYGLADIENQVPFTTNTLCWIASITKPVTVAAAMTLVDAGKLPLDDLVEKYLPDFREQVDTNGIHQVFTIRQLMSHTSGLVPNPPTRRSAWPIGGPLDETWLEENLPHIVQTIARSQLRFKPGSKFEYSNSALFVLGSLIEVISGKPYAAYVKDKILDPLGMTDTHYAPPASEAKRVAVIYATRDGKRETIFRFNPAVKISNTAPDGGLFSYPAQLMPFLQMFLDNDGRVLSRRAVADMLTPQPHGWGLGWSLSDGLFLHEGSSGTVAWGDPKTGVIGILFLQYRDQNKSDERLRKDFREAVQTSFAGATGASASMIQPTAPFTAIPAWFPKAPPLPSSQGEVIRVSTPDELLGAVDRAGPGATILVADGHYKMPRVIILQQKKDLTIRSAAGDPAKVTLTGKGWDSNDKRDDIIHVGHCDGVTIADLTFADCHSYGVKVEAENALKNVHIYNCRFRDIGMRAIKGSAGQDPNVRAVKGSVRYCQFENTKVPPADWLYSGDYIAAIDMMALEDWTLSDNLFRNIKGRNGGGRAAIFIWVRSRQIVVERNLIIDCDRGVAFGNPGQSTANRAGEQLVYVADGIIRNNFIVGGADCGIELWYAERIKVFNNSIWRPERNWTRGIRIGTGTGHTDIANNLVHGEIRIEGGEAQLRQNLARRLDGDFVDPASGNLALSPAATGAIAEGVSLPEVPDDIRGRPRRGRPDLGAWESDRKEHR